MYDVDVHDAGHHVDFMCDECCVQHLLSRWELMKIVHEFDFADCFENHCDSALD